MLLCEKQCLFAEQSFLVEIKMCENAVCEVQENVIFYSKFELSYVSFERQRVCHKIWPHEVPKIMMRFTGVCIHD